MKKEPKAVYIIENGGYTELTYEEFRRRVQICPLYADKLFLIGQLEDGFLELVRHNAFHYGVAYIRLLCYEDILTVEFIGGQSVVGNIAVS